MRIRLALAVLAGLVWSAAPVAAQDGEGGEPLLERYHLPPEELIAELDQAVAGASLADLDIPTFDRVVELARRLREEGQADQACRRVESLTRAEDLEDLAAALPAALAAPWSGYGPDPLEPPLVRLVLAHGTLRQLSDICATVPGAVRSAATARFLAAFPAARTAVARAIDGLAVGTESQRRTLQRATAQAAEFDMGELIRGRDERVFNTRERLEHQLRMADPALAARLAGARYRSARGAGDGSDIADEGLAYLRLLAITGDRAEFARVRGELRALFPTDPETLHRVTETAEGMVEHCHLSAIEALADDNPASDGIPAFCPEYRTGVYTNAFAWRFEQVRRERSPETMLRMYLADHAANSEPPDESFVVRDPLRPATAIWERIRPGARGAEADATTGLFRLMQGFGRLPVVNASLWSPSVDIDLALATGRQAAAMAGLQRPFEQFLADIETLRDVRVLNDGPSMMTPMDLQPGGEPDTSAPSGPERSVGGAGGSRSVTIASLDDITPEALARRRAAAEASIARQTALLTASIPDWPEIMSVEPLRLDTAQRLLRPDEALIVVDTTHFGTTTVAVTTDGAQTHVSNWDSARMERAVDRLTWELGAQPVPRGSTIELMWQSLTQDGALYSVGLAHQIYAETIAPLAGLLASKRHLIVVARGPAQRLPFATLISRPPGRAMLGGADLRDSHWLIDDFAISHLPTVRALQLLRRRASAPPAAGLSFVGIGVTGASAAPATCSLSQSEGRALASRMRSANEATYRSPAALRDALPPLPCAQRELDLIAAGLSGARASIVSGDRATEQFVRSREVSGANLLVFATHGLTARPDSGLNESALVLHPTSDEAAADGLLISSEIRTLDLAADWVILSACNSGTGTNPGSAPLDGLAQAFLLAGAKSLLVSYWPIIDDVAPTITAAAVAEVQRSNGAVTRAMGLREAMIRARRRDDPAAVARDYAHPSRWASFTLIGD